MERFVWNAKWRLGLSWTVAIAMFVAVAVFGAPPMTIAGVIVGEMLFIAIVSGRGSNTKDRARR
jgi:Ca2+/H+ antiporter